VKGNNINKMASAYLKTLLGLLSRLKAVLMSRFVFATSGSIHVNPMMINNTSIASFIVPKMLISSRPHRRDIVCSKQQNVLIPIAMAHTFAGVTTTSAACKTLSPKATEFAAVFPTSTKDIP
jgi:hypothetical protein